jgi:CHASE3 domain sensor protein
MVLLNRMGIRAKLLVAAVPLLMVLMGVSLYSSVSMSQLGKSLGIVNRAWQDVTAATELENGVLAMRASVGKFLATGRRQPLDAAAEEAQHIDEQITVNRAVAMDAARQPLVDAEQALSEFVGALRSIAAAGASTCSRKMRSRVSWRSASERSAPTNSASACLASTRGCRAASIATARLAVICSSMCCACSAAASSG